MKNSDASLVECAKSGDFEAFEALFNKYQGRIYNIIYQMIGYENDAADLTQDVFVQFYESLSRIRVKEAFYSYLCKIAVNLCRDYLKK